MAKNESDALKLRPPPPTTRIDSKPSGCPLSLKTTLPRYE
jgi:hypothetical protein